MKRILIVDDYPDVADSLASLLVMISDSPLTIKIGLDGATGVALAGAHCPTLVFMDIDMPVHRRLPGFPIVFVSGFPDTVVLGGISDAVLFKKPFTGEVLSDTLSAAMAAHGRGRPSGSDAR